MQPSAADSPSLIGYAQSGAADGLSARVSEELDVALVWKAAAAVPQNLLVNLRLVDKAGKTVWQDAGGVPVGGLYPTNAWRADEVVTDFHRLPIDAAVPPGPYTLEVALFPPFEAVNEGWTAVAPVTILAGPTPMPSHRLRAWLDGRWLLGLRHARQRGARRALHGYAVLAGGGRRSKRDGSGRTTIVDTLGRRPGGADTLRPDRAAGRPKDRATHLDRRGPVRLARAGDGWLRPTPDCAGWRGRRRGRL